MAGLAAQASRKYSYCSKGLTKDREKLTDLLEYSASESEPEDDLSAESAISSCGEQEDNTRRTDQSTENVSEVDHHILYVNSNAYLYRNHRIMILSHPDPAIGKTNNHQRGQRRLSCKMTCLMVKVTHKTTIVRV